MPRVSVILSSLNHGKFIAAAIQSVLDQTFPDFELFIIDDCSEDDSWETIQSFRDPRIIASRNSKRMRGVYGFNETIRHRARGDYIAIHHSDDIFLPSKLATQVAFLDDHPGIAAAFTGVEIIDESGNSFTDAGHFYSDAFVQPNRSRHEWLRHFLVKGNNLCHPSVLLRRTCLDTIGLYDRRFGQLADLDMWVRLCMHFDIHVLPQALLRFRIRDQERNQSGNRIETRIRCFVELQQILRHYLDMRSTDELKLILPEITIGSSLPPHPAIPFSLATFATRQDSDALRAFGLSVLYELMSLPETAKQIEEWFGFTYLDLIRLSGNSDFDFTHLKYMTELEQEIQRMKSSLSWQVTKPLRFLAFLWRKLVRAGRHS